MCYNKNESATRGQMQILWEIKILQEGCAPSGAPTCGEQVMVTYTNCMSVFVCLCTYVSVCRNLRDLLKKNVKKFKVENSCFEGV